MFKSNFLSTDILSVASYSKYILAGVGNNFYIYEDEELKLKFKIFDGERIHDIYVYEEIVIIKGCKELTIIILDEDCKNYHILSHIKSRDWIQDVFYDLKKKILVLATAHNAIEFWDVQESHCLKSYTCEEKCILYCCKFVNKNVEEFVLLCGTVFSEIVIWAPLLSHYENQPVMHRLRGHDGVIFSIAFSEVEKIICSTSDDRSLRIWHVDCEKSVLQRKVWTQAKITLIHTLYGHTARVWKSLILSDCIISSGEDSRLCVWNKNGRLENRLEIHQESGIRGLCRFKSTECIVTGGEDGGIILLTPERLQSHALSSSKRDTYSLNENAYGLPRKVAFLREDIICTTDRGYVLLAKGQSMINVIYEDKEISNYCLLEVSKCKRFLLLGSIKGRVVLIESKTKMVSYKEQLIDGKIFAVHWLNGYIIVCASNGLLLIFRIDFNPSFTLVKEKSFLLPNAKERWTTCALIHQNYLIVGDYMGSIHVYSLISVSESPLQSFPKVHGHLGVTDIIQDGNSIFSSGRDGKVKLFHASDNGITYSMKFKLQLEWPWRIVKTADDRLILGFSSVHFVIWSMKKRELLAKFECGGGHRSCDFIIKNNSCKFLYIRDKMIHISDFPLFRSRHIRTGFHGKEINCLKIIQESPLIFVSGSEDTTIRISTFDGYNLDQLYVIENHISSVRDVNVLAVSESERLLFSAGGRGQISVHKFNLKGGKYEETENYFLYKSERKMNGPELEGETRVMCVHSIANQDDILVSAACSDRQIRIFNFRNSLNLLTSIPHSHCILKVEFVQVNSSLILLSMGTDGFVIFWNVTHVQTDPNSIMKIDSISIHQSGINSFVLRDFKDGRFLLATGGDDNLLSVLLFRLDTVHGVKVTHNWKNSNSHSSQITGIKLLGNTLLTTSVDQRLTVWRCTVNGDVMNVEFINQYMSPVADIQGMDAFHRTNSSALAFVHGKGIEMIEIEIPP